jgi:predicted nucleic-acid-binding Zn-ribbon protein
MTLPVKCPKCSGRMEEGFVLDRTYGANLQATWVEGSPTKSFWTGVQVRGRQRLPVTTFRCSSCGYLESFAAPTSTP